MFNISANNKKFLENNFDREPLLLTKSQFSKPSIMFSYAFTAPFSGLAKLITGIAYVAIQIFKAIKEYFSKAEKKTALEEIKFGGKLIAQGLVQLVPLVNAFAKIYQLDKAEKTAKKEAALAEAQRKEKALKASTEAKAKPIDSIKEYEKQSTEGAYLQKTLCGNEFRLFQQKLGELKALQESPNVLTSDEIIIIDTLMTSLKLAFEYSQNKRYSETGTDQFSNEFKAFFTTANQ